MSSSKSFTVRLSPEDQAALEALADLFETDRSETMRRALRLALTRRQPPADGGQFVPAQTAGLYFTVHMHKEARDE